MLLLKHNIIRYFYILRDVAREFMRVQENRHLCTKLQFISEIYQYKEMLTS